MISNRKSTLVRLALLSTLAASAATAQPDAWPYSRTLSIGGVGKEPRFTLDISASGRFGKIIVHDKAGTKVQTLTCDLYRDWAAGTHLDPDAAAGRGERFVSGLEAADLDFDGLPDIMAERDYTSQTRYYCVWLFDPHQGRFKQDALSRQMEDLVNLTVDAGRRQIISFSANNLHPSHDEYRVATPAAGPRRLLPVRACALHNGPAEPWTWNVVTYVDGREVTETRPVSRDCHGQCGDGCPAPGGGKMNAVERWQAAVVAVEDLW